MKQTCFWLAAAVAASAGAPEELRAQDPQAVQAELVQLRARIDSLEAALARLQPGGERGQATDALAELRAAAQQAAAQAGPDTATAPGAEVQFTGLQRSLQALNPEISANVDVFGHLNTDDVHDQNFVPREFEFSFQSALDPYSRAKIFVAHHAAGPELVPFEEEEGHEHGDEGTSDIDIEEGYVEWVGLPGGLTLKLGRFLQRFGTLNRWHAHALPFQSRSLPHLAFIGEESLGQTGGSVSWLLPVHGAGAWELTGELTRSSNERLFGASTRASALAHLNAFWQLSRSTDLDLGLSWTGGRYQDEELEVDRNLFGLEGAFTWRPPESAGYRGLVVRGGAMLLDGLVPHEHEGEEPEEEEADRALGLWGLAELRLSERWYAGARFDRTESPEDPEHTAWLFSPTLTWWQSEFVRLRLEYDLLGRSFLDDDEGRLWLQVTFAMGPHKHETY